VKGGLRRLNYWELRN